MRRADRLFQLVQLLRGRRLSTAAWLAERLAVSARTVYRDVADLQARGVPIEGEAGVGYRLQAGLDLPPLMFSRTEAQALVAAVRLVQLRLDPGLAHAAEAALGKILCVLPPAARVAAETVPVHAAPWDAAESLRAHLGMLREAIETRHKLRLQYRDAAERRSERLVRPLACFHWDSVWTLAAWCEHRGDFRNFRLDRIEGLRLEAERFRDEPGRTLADFQRAMEAPARARGAAVGAAGVAAEDVAPRNPGSP